MINPFSPKYILITLLAVFLSFGLHEASHWFAGELIGYNMTMSMNSASPIDVDTYQEEWHGMVISAAGPLFTILQAAAIYLLMRRKPRPLLYPFLFVPLVMRIMAALLGFVHPNDEARISHDLGLSIWTLPAIVCGLLFYFVYRISRQYVLPIQFNLMTLTFVLLFSSIVILVIK